MKSNILSLLDSYKISHKWQYPPNTQMVYSNWTIRSSRLPVDKYVFFGLQYFLKEYLIDRWNTEFFNKPKEEALRRFRKTLKNSLGITDVSHYEALHDLGYLPLEILALPEGTYVPIRTPCLTIRNTVPEFYWLTNMLETVTSCVLWGMINNATVASMFAKIRRENLAITDSVNHPLEPFLNHNFAYRGMMGNEAAITTDAAWLLFSCGSDTVPGLEFMEDYYNADSDKELISGSIPATEHSVACAGGKDGEVETFQRLVNLYKDTTKIFSFVCDTWDYFHFINETLREQKQFLLDSGCKCVVRPDSSKKTPYEIICGDRNYNLLDSSLEGQDAEFKGSLEILWDVFGGTTNSKGFRVLHPQIGLIYGEAISPDMYEKICKRMIEMGFCVSNLVVGVGSFSQTYHTRDTLGQAFKATAVTIDNKLLQIFKDPKTDDGTKKSLKGRVAVFKREGEYVVEDGYDHIEPIEGDCLVPVWRDGKLLVDWTLAEVRENLKNAVN